MLAQLRAYSDTVVRVAGPDRYATAVALLEHGRDDVSLESDGVLLATGTTFPDALAASTASSMWGAPVLLVETNRLPPVVSETLERAQPCWITILGGPNAVSPAVEEQLHDLVGVPEWEEYG